MEIQYQQARQWANLWLIVGFNFNPLNKIYLLIYDWSNGGGFGRPPIPPVKYPFPVGCGIAIISSLKVGAAPCGDGDQCQVPVPPVAAWRVFHKSKRENSAVNPPQAPPDKTWHVSKTSQVCFLRSFHSWAGRTKVMRILPA
jgi:hypothetical protein